MCKYSFSATIPLSPCGIGPSSRFAQCSYNTPSVKTNSHFIELWSKENYHKYRVQIECHDARNYEHGVTAVVSLRLTARRGRHYGLSSAFYYLFAAIVFLIPTAMVVP